jgi:formylglycine-generating enzyme
MPYRMLLLAALVCAVVTIPSWTAAEPQKPVADQWPKEITNSIGMKLVRIPAGKFTMGSTKKEQDDAIAAFEKLYGRKASETESAFYRVEGPQHEVEITNPFWLGIHEVTQGQFEKVMGYNPSYFSRDGQGRTGVKYKDAGKPAGGKDKVLADTSGYPVENVSWEEAVELCQKLTKTERGGRRYRLPTEAEWEYSCRGGADSATLFHFGDSLSPTQANFDGNYPHRAAAGKYLECTCKVGSYKQNAFGLFDMQGNVWEWCADWYGSDYYAKSPRRDPPGAADGSMKVYRGGSWYDTAQNCRSAFRGRNPPGDRNNNRGFRVALVPSGK